LSGVTMFGSAGRQRRRQAMRRCRAGWPILLPCLASIAMLAGFSSPASAQTKTHPIDVLAKPAAPQEPRSQIGVNYEYENFDKDLTPWNWVSLEYSHRFDWGASTGRTASTRRPSSTKSTPIRS
jgi:hypothetical protein